MAADDSGNQSKSGANAGKTTRFASFRCNSCGREVQVWGAVPHIDCEHCGARNDVPEHLK